MSIIFNLLQQYAILNWENCSSYLHTENPTYIFNSTDTTYMFKCVWIEIRTLKDVGTSPIPVCMVYSHKLYNAALNMQTSSSSDSYKIRPPCCVAVLMHMYSQWYDRTCAELARVPYAPSCVGLHPKRHTHTTRRGAVAAAVSHHNSPYHIIENFQTFYLPVHRLGKQRSLHMQTHMCHHHNKG